MRVGKLALPSLVAARGGVGSVSHLGSRVELALEVAVAGEPAPRL